MRILLLAAITLAALVGCGKDSAEMYCLVADGEVIYRGWHEVKIYSRDGDRFLWRLSHSPREGLAHGKRVEVFRVPWNEDCLERPTP